MSELRRSDEAVLVEFTVNGERARVHVEPRRLLSDVLRHDLDLHGTHIGCEHGGCGACTVLIDGVMARSCTAFAVQVHGAEIRTIEGFADGDELHPIQEAFRQNHGLQCGFCTPGMIVATEALLAEHPNPTEEQIREHLTGNICRCTGYSGIVASVQEAARRLAQDDNSSTQPAV